MRFDSSVVTWLLIVLVIGGLGFFGWRHFKIKSMSSGDDTRVLAEKITHELADYMSSHKLSVSELRDRVMQVIDKNNFVVAAIAAYAPHAYDQEAKLFSVSYGRTDNQVLEHPITYDYTLPSEQAGAQTDWFNKAMTQEKGWIAPYYGVANKRNITSYMVRIYAADDAKHERPIGVVGVALAA